MSNQSQDYNKSHESRKLYFARHDGVLSTLSRHQDIEGFPFGSVTPFCLDRKGRIVILISDLAQHYKNISGDDRVSMTIQADVDRTTDVQSHARLTYIGHAAPIPEAALEGITSRYIRYLPAAEQYFEAHSFKFYRIEMVKGRFIAGFGKIFWLEPDELLIDNPFDEETELGIITHMNDDHQTAMKTYLERKHGLETGPDTTLQMVGIDSLGCDIRRDGFIHRIWFETPVTDSTEAREQLTQLARH